MVFLPTSLFLIPEAKLGHVGPPEVRVALADTMTFEHVLSVAICTRTVVPIETSPVAVKIIYESPFPRPRAEFPRERLDMGV